MNAVCGAIFPILSEHVSRIFDQGRRVYVNYTNMTRLHEKAKIVFYQSGEDRRIVGEGIIDKIARMSSDMAWSRYGTQIFLNKNEFDRYALESPIEEKRHEGKKRKKSEITVFVLGNVRKYDEVNRLGHKLTPAGCYLTKEDYRRLKK